jgi:hypothetical protein
MRIRRLSPRTRTRFLASGLFLIGLSTTANLLSPAGLSGESSDAQSLTKARAELAVDVQPAARRSPDCPAAG